MFLRRYTRTRKASGTSTSRSSRASAPTPARASTSSPTAANSTPLWNDAGNAPSSSTIARANPSNYASSPTTTTVPLDDDPDVVRIRLGKVGWTNGRGFGDVLAGPLAVAAPGPGRHRRTPSARGQTHRSPRRHRGHRSHQPPLCAVQRVCLSGTLVRIHSARRLVGRAGRRHHQGSSLSHSRPTTGSQGSHRKRSENTLRRPLRRRLRPLALRPDQQPFRGRPRTTTWPAAAIRATTAATVSRWSSPRSSRDGFPPGPLHPARQRPRPGRRRVRGHGRRASLPARPRACG